MPLRNAEETSFLKKASFQLLQAGLSSESAKMQEGSLIKLFLQMSNNALQAMSMLKLKLLSYPQHGLQIISRLPI
jgi:hypothetical protein